MARAKIELPEKFLFTTELKIRISDINYGGHLGNDALLALIHEARVQFLQALGFSEQDVDGCGIIMADAVIVYKSQAYYGETLHIAVTVNDFGKRACDLVYLLSHQPSGKEIARAKTRIAFFDYRKNVTTSIPEKFLSLFREHDK